MHGILLTLVVSLGASAGAQPEIHRCTQEDGTVAFQETPCPEPAGDDDGNNGGDDQSDRNTSAAADDFFDFVNPFDEPAEPPAPPELEPRASRDRAECEQMTRDAIDAIDAEMREGYTKEEGKRYLADLLELTQQLRDCKRL